MKQLPPGAQQESEYCHGCPLASRQYVPGEGHSDCPCLVVGGAPGQIEEEKALPFQGPSGLLLREILAGLSDLERMYLTNVLKRRPLSVDGTNRKPTREECWKCGSHLMTEIVRHRPKVVLVLGQVATTFFLGQRMRISQVHGLPIPVIKFQTEMTVIPTFDPAYVLRSGGLNSRIGDSFVADIEEAIDLMARKGV